jgi:dTDP-4-dehydrorhamnose reductase
MKNQCDNVLVLGVTGMLGSAVLRYFAERPGYRVTGTIRSASGCDMLPEAVRDRVISGIDVENFDSLMRAFAETRPQVVINCIGLVKQLAEADDPLNAIPVNSLFPHRLARLCAAAGARLVHVSTDCVFSGSKGMYKESDVPDATDLYGRTKHLGEVDYPNAITLRTSIIGHELRSSHGLISWFLSQKATVRGFTKAVFSGLPTVELARVIHDFVLPNERMRGIYHVSAEPIDKYTLLCNVARVYGLTIDIVPDAKLVIDRSLDSSRFRAETGYVPASWPELIVRMREFG